jgi:hypothetical protein
VRPTAGLAAALTAALAAAPPLVACGGSGGEPAGRASGARAGPDVVRARYAYPPATVREFVEQCASSASQRAVCRCTIDRLQRTLPYADFDAADRAFRAGRPLPAPTRRAIGAATSACRDDG